MSRIRRMRLSSREALLRAEASAEALYSVGRQILLAVQSDPVSVSNPIRVGNAMQATAHRLLERSRAVA